MKLTYRSDKVLLAILCIFFLLVYIAAYSQHAFYSDENSYLGLGQEILEGSYTRGIFDRAPVLPSLVSLSYILGLDPFQVKFILPAMFGMLFVIVTYLLGKRLCNNGLIPALVVLSFPYFWKWQPFLLVDILLGVFSGLSLLFFYKGMEDDGRFFLYSGISLALAMLTKFSGILLIPIFIFYVLYRKELHILKSREFLRGLLAFLIIFGVIASLAMLSSLASNTISLGDYFRIFENYFRIPTYYILMFAFVPWSLVSLYGIYRAIKSRSNECSFALIAFFTVFIFFHLIAWKEMRFLLFIIPMFAVLIGRGLMDMGKHAKYTIIVLLFLVCFAQSMLLLDASSHVTWGLDIMTREALALPGDAIIASDFGNIYNKGLSGRFLDLPDNATTGWIESNNPDYIILSIYGEIRREPNLDYYKPRLGPLDVSFMEGETPKNILTWWPGYQFGSGLYQEIDSTYTLFKKIIYNDQDVFIIYRVV